MTMTILFRSLSCLASASAETCDKIHNTLGTHNGASSPVMCYTGQRENRVTMGHFGSLWVTENSICQPLSVKPKSLVQSFGVLPYP